MIRFPFLSTWPAKSGNGKAGDAHTAEQHARELEQFRTVLESYGATRIEERLTILDLFLSVEQHVTLSELEQLILEKNPGLRDRSFLRETMEMFCQFGFAKERSFESRETQYEHRHLGQHHDHFICTRCGSIQEFVDPGLERLQMAIAKGLKFHPLQHKMEIYGLCAECMAQRDDTIPLLLAANGERVQIVRLLGGREMQARLTAMGLTVGTCLQVINNHPSGPFIVAVNDARMALGTGMAEKIVVAHACEHK
ncbi:MAG: transcriptional repressor [Desulfobacteraceae bacterium]|nr:transcriptional repressor [Desulfobacteraceae bacterium]